MRGINYMMMQPHAAVEPHDRFWLSRTHLQEERPSQRGARCSWADTQDLRSGTTLVDDARATNVCDVCCFMCYK